MQHTNTLNLFTAKRKIGIWYKVISQLKEDGLIISKWRKGSFVSQRLRKTR